MEEILVRYLHFIGIIFLASGLVSTHVLASGELNANQFKRVVFTDAVYGLGALLALIAGVLLLVKVGKPAEFYTKNPVFHAKITLFVIMGVLSIFPTRYFLKNRKFSGDSIQVPKKIIMIIRMELLLLLVIPLIATIMAKGIGLT